VHYKNSPSDTVHLQNSPSQPYLDNYWYEKMQKIIKENKGKYPKTVNIQTLDVADKGDRIDLKPSWCKGGRSRSIDVKKEVFTYLELMQKDRLAIERKSLKLLLYRLYLDVF
jgi:hypothetical protein